MPDHETFADLHYDEATDRYEQLLCEFGRVKNFNNASPESHVIVAKKYPQLARHASEHYASLEARRAIHRNVVASFARLSKQTRARHTKDRQNSTNRENR